MTDQNKKEDVKHQKKQLIKNKHDAISNELKFGKKNKKNQISINHLLDFRSYQDEHPVGQHKPRRSSNNRRPTTPRLNLSGMRFINVNYKFVVDFRKGYNIQELDPNIPIDLEDIIRVIVPKGQSCPICLSDELVAPRMITSCGHIICLKCVLSLLETRLPNNQKKESSAIIEKYKECPLCFSIIRKNELKPVYINEVDERFEIPKVNDDVILNLMIRQTIALPKQLAFNEKIPSIEQEEFLPYLRLFKGGWNYISNMYEAEKQQVMEQYISEKEIFGDDSRLVNDTISYIDKEIENWKNKLTESVGEEPSSNDITSPTFYFYQTGFNAGYYVLSPFDMKVLKSTYLEYSKLPSTIIAKIETVKYEELNHDLIKKYKYLSHLPLGTQIGFLECNWSNNEFINKDTWNMFKDDLLKRSKNSNKKLKREDRNKKRAMSQEEYKARQFYRQENGEDDEEFYGNIGSLSIIDNRDLLPSLSDSKTDHHTTEEEIEYETTVWGTKIPKGENHPIEESEDDDWINEEMIRKAKEEMMKQENKKKKKKKLILLSN